MQGIWLSLAVATSGLCAPVNTTDRPQDKKTEDKSLIERSPVQWLKVYNLPINVESWRLEGSVPSLDRLPTLRRAAPIQKEPSAFFLG